MSVEVGKIIVITPIKNEDWILDQFLSVTSFFADHILIADQQSEDKSIEICKKYPKVMLIENNGVEYDEASRQILLINKAREIFGDQKIVLFALDVDEIISFSSLVELEVWNNIKSAEPGTTFLFEKPDILPGLSECIRWENNYFPIAFVDDGSIHIPKKIHSRRIPQSTNGMEINIPEIKILHFAVSRTNVQSAKMRYYSMLENINNTSSFYIRRKVYQSEFNPSLFYSHTNPSEMPNSWIYDWKEMGIHFNNLPDPKFSWYDLKALELFDQYGSKRFFLDNIWNFNWIGCLAYWSLIYPSLNKLSLHYPPYYVKFFTSAIDYFVKQLSDIKKLIRS